MEFTDADLLKTYFTENMEEKKLIFVIGFGPKIIDHAAVGETNFPLFYIIGKPYSTQTIDLIYKTNSTI